MISAIVNIVSFVNSVSGRLKRQAIGKLLLAAGSLLLVSMTSVVGQTNYYSKNTGNLNLVGTWGLNTDGSGTSPTNFTTANQIFNIRNNAAPTIGTNWIVSGVGSSVIVGNGTVACVFTVPASLQFNAACNISNNGTLKITSTNATPYTGTLTVNSGGTYEHARDAGTIPIATWDPASNCLITGITTSTGFTAVLDGQTFGNFTWNCPFQTSNFYLASNFNVAGNFTVSGTGGPDHINQSLRMSNTATGYLITVAGNFVINTNATFKMNNSGGSCILNVGGNFTLNGGNFTIVTGTVNSILTVGGNVNISGGTLVMKEDAAATIGTMNVKGNFTLSGGTITLLNAATGIDAINFNGNTTQTYLKTAGTIVDKINFAVISGSILDVGTSLIDGSSGTFTLSSGAGIITANTQGLWNNAGTGSIQVTGTRTFNAGADYTYNGSVAQVTGDAIPIVHNLTVNNSNGLTLTNGVTVTGSLTLTQGKVTTGGNILYLSNGAVGSLNYGAASFISGNFERAINSPASNYYFPVGVAQRQMAKLNFANLTNGSLRVNYQGSAPAGSGLPLFDTDGQRIQYEFNNGFWTTLALNSLASTNYSMTLDATGFNNPANINSSTRVIKRTGGSGAWTINGTPGTVTGTILERLACNGIDNSSGSQFGAGTGNCFTFPVQPVTITRCIGGSAAFSVSVSGGLGAFTYQWYRNGGQLSNAGNISGATTNNLVISNLSAIDEASYYCLVTDNCSSQASQTALLTIPRPAAALGYAYEKTLTIDHTKVFGGSNLINFPVLINITVPELRTIPLGHIENATGYDIIFTDPNYNKLDHQIESYDPTTGNLVAWVRIPALSPTSNTTIRLLYGNPFVSADPSSLSTWEPGYSAVYHLNDLLDATAFNNDGTDNGSTAAAGFIGFGREFNGTSRISVPQNSSLEPANSLTVSFWMRRNGSQNLWAKPLWYGTNNDGPWGPYGFEYASGDELQFHVGNGTDAGDITSGTFSNSTWYLLTGTYDGSTSRIYVNGSQVGTVPIAGPIGQYGTYGLGIGDKEETGQGFIGFVDEVRISTIVRSADWIATEYANQNSPSTFYSIGGETICSVYTFSGLCSGSPITYNVPNTAGHTYSWAVTGGTPSSTNGNSITVTWNVSGTYSIQLTESDGICNGSSIPYSLVVAAQPVIATQPVGTILCYNATHSMSVVVSGGTALSYQWQLSPNGTNGWTNVGADSPNYTTPGITNNSYYKVIISSTGNGCSTPIESLVVGVLIETVVPTITCPAAISQNDDAGVCHASVIVPNAVTADNCSVTALTWAMTGAIVASSPAGGINQVGTYTFNTGVTTVTYIVKDGAGNQATCSFTVTITDNINPSITCPAVITQNVDAGVCNASVVVPNATIADNCAVTTLTWALTGATVASSPAAGINQVGTRTFNTGITTVTYIVKDGAGNQATCNFTVTITDNQKPVFTSCPVNVSVNSDAGVCTASVITINPVTTDNCGVTKLTWALTGSTTGSSAATGVNYVGTYTFNVGLTTVTYTATDAAGNISNVCSFTVTVNDTEKPVISGCPSNIVQVNDAGNCSAVVTWTEPTAADNCTAAGSLVWTKSHLPGAVFTVGTTTVTYTATDAAGNISNVCSFTVTVNDTEKPVAICKNINITLDLATGSKTITPADIDNGSIDNCGIASISASKTDFDCSNIGANNVILTVTDIHGNSSTCNSIVTVNYAVTPDPIVTPVSDVICDGETTNLILTNNIPVTSWTWTVVAPPQISGASDDLTGTKTSIQQTLINSDDIAHKVVYTITPRIYNSCDLTPIISEVWVNPTPQVIPSRLEQTICNNGTTSIILTSPSTFTSGVITFNYTVIATGGVTGFTTPVNGLLNNSVISDVLNNPTNTFQTVTYTIVPISLTGCAAGPSKTVVITVDPTPQVVPSTRSETICNDGTTHVVLYSPSIFSNGVITFSYTVAATGGVTGFTPAVAGLPNNYIISDALHNPTDSPQTVTYTIIPISPGVCSPTDPGEIVVFTVNPTPRIFPLPANGTQCDSLVTSIQLQSPSIFTNGPITFDYGVTTTGGVTGYTTPPSGLPNNHIIADRLKNETDHFQIVTYSVVPVSPPGCSNGPAQDVNVTVNPTPRVVPNNIYSAICYVGTPQALVNTQIVLTSPTVMTSGAMRFDFTVSVTGGPGVIVGNTIPGANLLPGYTINLQYQNNSDILQSVYYSITPKNNTICVPGKTVVSEVKIHPQPLQSIVVTKPFTCSGGAGLAALLATVSIGADPYQIVWDGPVGYHKVDSLAIANLSSGKYVLKVTDSLGCNREESIIIVPKTANPLISALPIPPGNYNISCIGSTDGTILVSVTGGITPPYNYWVVKNDVDTLYSGLFTNNYNLLDPTTYTFYNNLGAGSYTLVIKDVNLCENISRIVFRVPQPVVVDIRKATYAGSYNISCKGYNDGSAWIQTISGGRGGFTYRWYTFNGNIPGPINTNWIDNLIAGTYFLEIKDVLNCITTVSIDIIEPDGMQLASSLLSKTPDGNFNISCNGNSDGFINMTVSGGSGNYVFSWTGPAGYTASTKDITGLKAGVYTCSVLDLNGCILTPPPSFTLIEPLPLVIAPPTTSVSSDGAYNINCYGTSTGWINITVSGGSTGNYKYNWSTANGSGIINGQKDQPALSAGTYHLAVTDSNNCVTSKDIILTQPPVYVTHLAATNITCLSPGFNNGSIDLTVSGGVAPYSFLWSNGATTEDISGLTQGSYKVTVTDFNGCIKRDSISIDLPPPLSYSKNLSDYNGYNISCNGMANGSIHVDPTTGSAPYIYTWTGPNGFTAPTKDISGLEAGSYNLMIVDSRQCKATETIDLTEPGKLTMTITLSESIAGGFNINCAGDSTGSIDIVPLNQVNTVDYLWSDGVFGKTRTNLPAGNYNVIITDANNCQASSAITLTEPDSMKLVFDITQPFCPDKPDGEIRTNVNGGVRGTDYLYLWSDNSTNKSLSNIPKGLYKVTVTDMNGCSLRDSVKVEALNETCLIIPNAISPNGDLINDVWNIGLIELYPLMEVKIFNRWGESIWRSEKGYPKPWDGTCNGASLPIDSYHFIIDLHNGTKPIIGNVTIVR